MNDESPRAPGNDVSASTVGAAVQAGVVHGGVHLGSVNSAHVKPQQLPTYTADFVGRQEELTWLDVVAASASQTVTIVAIGGAAGIGKTALVLRWAHLAQDRFPQGQLYIDLRGFGWQEPVTCSQALHGFLISLGISPEAVPVALEEKAGLYRSLLHDRRMLVVLDNAIDSSQVRPLLPSGVGCVVLVTCRGRLDGLMAREGARQIILDLLPREDSLALLERRVGVDRIAQEPAAAASLVERCARLPLALSIAAARAASRPKASLVEFMGELSDESALLDSLNLGEEGLDLRAVFSWSYKALGSATQAVFRLLGVHTGPDIAVNAAASLIGKPVAEVRAHLARLTAAHLIDEHQANRYGMHDLLRVYAVELAREDEVTFLRSALRRLLDHYVHTGLLADKKLYAYREPMSIGVQGSGVIVDLPVDYGSALRWFTVEHFTLLAAVVQAQKEGFDMHAWQLPWCLATYLDRRGHWRDYEQTLTTAVAAATKIGDRKVLARTLRLLGRAKTLLFMYDDARQCCEDALRIHEELDDTEGRARSHRSLSMIHQASERYEEALKHAKLSRHLFQMTGNRSGEARVLNTIASCGTELGRYNEAISCCQDAIRLFAKLAAPDPQGEASAVDGYAYALHRLGRQEEAVGYYQRAIGLWQKLGNRYYEAKTLIRLGFAYRDCGSSNNAEEAWCAAVEILSALNHRDMSLIESNLVELRRNIRQR